MIPPIFPVVKAHAPATALLGETITRFYLFDRAPEPGTPAYGLPYAVWQTASGAPENNLGDAPEADFLVLQVTVFGQSASEVDATVDALRGAIEPVMHITRIGDTSREDDTGLYYQSFDVDWWLLK